jgi:hypothetical protein
MGAELALVGWHCALAGGVLRAGASNHDLDVVVFPHKRTANPRPNMRGLRSALRRLGFEMTWSRKEMQANWKKRGIKDRKWVEIWSTADNRRVDIMVLS